MKKFQTRLGILTVLALTALSTTARAEIYDLTFDAATPDNTVADGQITVVDGLATAGFLDVTAGPDVGDYNLVAGSGTDQSFVYDNFVFPGSPDGFVDSTAGLLWSLSGVAGNSSEVNMWFNPTAQYGAPADTYSLWGAPGNWNLEAYGGATFTPAPIAADQFAPASIPDGGSTLVFLCGGMGCLIALRRNVLR
jgi:hypothetical protein